MIVHRYYVKSKDGEREEGWYLSLKAAKNVAKKANEKNPEKDWEVVPVPSTAVSQLKGESNG